MRFQATWSKGAEGVASEANPTVQANAGQHVRFAGAALPSEARRVRCGWRQVRVPGGSCRCLGSDLRLRWPLGTQGGGGWRARWGHSWRRAL